MATVLSGDLLECDADYIVQQCNCVSKTHLGLSSAIKKKFKISFYGQNDTRLPGTVVIKQRIVAFFAQVSPGKSKIENREALFQQCLDAFQPPEGSSIAFPFGIGCGLAGGLWPNYFTMINTWAMKNPSLKVFIYKLE
jgi:hypothetical protein